MERGLWKKEEKTEEKFLRIITVFVILEKPLLKITPRYP